MPPRKYQTTLPKVAPVERMANRESLIQLKPGEQNKYFFPKKENQWYQVLLQAKMRNEKTGEEVIVGKDTGRNSKSDYATSLQSSRFDFDTMYKQAIRSAYLKVVPPPFNGDPYDTDDWWDEDYWVLVKVTKVFVLIQRDVRVRKSDGRPRKVKRIQKSDLKEKKSYAKKKLSEKKKKVAERAKARKKKQKLAAKLKRLQRKNRR
jgi:hypothetical protein